MILTTHAIGGTVAALVFRTNPVLAFFAAFMSHFLLDMIPHWDYPLRSMRKKIDGSDAGMSARMHFSSTAFLFDLGKTGFDFALGGFVSLALTVPQAPELQVIVLLGIVGGVLPDFLQLVYFIFRREPLVTIQRFHVWVHANIRLIHERAAVGISSQLVLIILLSYIAYALVR